MTGKRRNPLKSNNQSKATTREEADRLRPDPVRTKAQDTSTGGPNSDDAGHADTDHPSQHGGKRADTPREEADRPGVKRNGPSPAYPPSDDRTGTAPDRGGGPTRSGKTGGDRQVR